MKTIVQILLGTKIIKLHLKNHGVVKKIRKGNNLIYLSIYLSIYLYHSVHIYLSIKASSKTSECLYCSYQSTYLPHFKSSISRYIYAHSSKHIHKYNLYITVINIREHTHTHTTINLNDSVRQWPERPEFSLWLSHAKDSKMVLDTSFLNTQQYKVHIKGKVEQSRERSCAPYTSV